MSEESPPVSVMQDLLAGGVAGSLSVCIGHPFDTYKVRLQVSAAGTKPSFSTFGTFFRGMGAPLSSAAVVNAVIFGSYGASSRLYDNLSLGHSNDSPDVTSSQRTTDQTTSSPLKSFICGSFAGAVQTLVICPTEHIKCRLQMKQSNAGHGHGSKKDVKFKGSMDALKKILTSHGISGLNRGFVCTAWREVPSFGAYFLVYDVIKDATNKLMVSTRNTHDSTSSDEDRKSSNGMHFWASSCLAGGISGAFTWLIVYPLDIIKTRIQTSPLNTPLEKRRIHYVASQILKDHGWRYFFRGLGVTLVRAFPVNAVVFPAYEYTLMQLREYGIGDVVAMKNVDTNITRTNDSISIELI